MQTAANCIKQPHQAPTARSAVRTLTVVAVGALVAVVGLSAAWTLALAWMAAQSRVTAPGPASTDELLALGAASVAVAVAAWLLLGMVLEVLSHVPGRIGRVADVWADRLTPALARRVAAFVLGVGVGVASGPSHAVASPRTAGSQVVTAFDSEPRGVVADPGFTPTGSADARIIDPGFAPLPADPGFTPHTTPAPEATAPPSPGFTPTAPRVRPQVDPGLLGGRVSQSSDGEVVVHRGDTLWAIAARHLGSQATDAEIARAWPSWFQLNRDLIGEDPDVILPGQILHVPDPQQTASVSR